MFCTLYRTPRLNQIPPLYFIRFCNNNFRRTFKGEVYSAFEYYEIGKKTIKKLSKQKKKCKNRKKNYKNVKCDYRKLYCSKWTVYQICDF